MSIKAKFDRDNILMIIMDTYWSKGFNGTSIRDIQAATDLRPGSLYTAFGSKEDMFKESLKLYAKLSVDEIFKCQINSRSVVEGLRLFILNLVVTDKVSNRDIMCFLQKSVAELTQENSSLLEVAQQKLEEIEQEFCMLLEKAMASGELKSTKSAEYLSRYLQIQILGLRNYLKTSSAVFTSNEINDMVNSIFESDLFVISRKNSN